MSLFELSAKLKVAIGQAIANETDVLVNRSAAVKDYAEYRFRAGRIEAYNQVLSMISGSIKELEAGDGA